MKTLLSPVTADVSAAYLQANLSWLAQTTVHEAWFGLVVCGRHSHVPTSDDFPKQQLGSMLDAGENATVDWLPIESCQRRGMRDAGADSSV